MEYWVEVNIGPEGEMDEFLCKLISPLIYKTFKRKWLSWHFFREPDLRLRLEWKSERSRKINNRALFSILNEWQKTGFLQYWYEGCHGEEDKIYQGEADIYGEEVWSLYKKDWFWESEFALVFLRLKSEEKLTKNLKFHWSRHVHLFSNRLMGWSHGDEIMLCLEQALKYINRIEGSIGERAFLVKKIKDLVKEAIQEESSLREADKELEGFKCYRFDQPLRRKGDK